MAQEGQTKITTASPAERNEYSAKTASLLAEIFLSDPGIRFVTSALSARAHAAYLPAYMRALMAGSRLNGALFQEAGGWASVAVWLPPGGRVDNPRTLLRAGLVGVSLRLGVKGVKKMLWDFQRQADRVKARALKEKGVQRFWYLFFIGTLEGSRGKGLASTVLKEWQAGLKGKGEEALPVWLEASTAHSRDVYLRCGFVVQGEFVLGEGSHGADGEERKGGPGVRIWSMLWMPGEEGERLVNGH